MSKLDDLTAIVLAGSLAGRHGVDEAVRMLDAAGFASAAHRGASLIDAAIVQASREMRGATCSTKTA